jgi:FixJ family two-component response regulator
VTDNADNLSVPLICIVDDDASMARSTQYLVRAFGFRAETFLSAEEFLESGLVEVTNCLLILVLRMPRMDGLELQRNLISTNKRIPIIFISARVTDEERLEALAGGAVDFLRKPFNEDALLKAIQAALNR